MITKQVLLKSVGFIMLLLASINGFAQVGIGTDLPEATSLLDISSTNKGILIPRVNITDLSTIDPITGGSVESLLVYNTNTTTGAGFYYWSGTSWIRLSDNLQGNNIYSNDDSLTSDRSVTQGNFDLDFNDNTLFIDGGANRIGVNTDAPESDLEVESRNNVGDAVVVIEADADNNFEEDNPRLELAQDSGLVRAHIGLNGNPNASFSGAIANSFYISTPTVAGGNIQFATGGTPTDPRSATAKMTIQSGGNVGIGVINPTQRLVVNGNALINNILQVIDNLEVYGITTLNDDITVIGNATISEDLTIDEDLQVDGITTLNGNITTNGDFTATGDTANTTGVWINNSDRRIKEVGTDFTDGLSVIKKIRPVNFKYTSNAPLYDGGKDHIGIIAQELEVLAPYMVDKSPGAGFTDLRSVNPQAYPFLLINAVKEQQSQIESLQNEVAELKALVNSLIESKK